MPTHRNLQRKISFMQRILRRNQRLELRGSGRFGNALTVLPFQILNRDHLLLILRPHFVHFLLKIGDRRREDEIALLHLVSGPDKYPFDQHGGLHSRFDAEGLGFIKDELRIQLRRLLELAFFRRYNLYFGRRDGLDRPREEHAQCHHHRKRDQSLQRKLLQFHRILLLISVR